MEANWVVWSYEHDAWWAPNERGYVQDLSHAGRYTELQAASIEAQANSHGVVNEKAMALVDAELLINGVDETTMMRRVRAIVDDPTRHSPGAVYTSMAREIARSKSMQPRDTAEILSRANVIATLGDLVGQAMHDSGIAAAARSRVVIGLTQRLVEGAPYPKALAVVETILGCKPDVHDTQRLDVLSWVAENVYADEVTVGQWTGRLDLPRVKTSNVESPKPTLREIADAYLDKHGTQFGAQSSTETKTALESAEG